MAPRVTPAALQTMNSFKDSPECTEALIGSRQPVEGGDEVGEEEVEVEEEAVEEVGEDNDKS